MLRKINEARMGKGRRKNQKKNMDEADTVGEKKD